MKACLVVLSATVAGVDAQFFWGSSGSGLRERRTKDTQPVLNVGALNGTLQHMISDVNGIKTGLQAAATSVANLEAKVKPPSPPLPGGLAAFHAVDGNNADSQAGQAFFTNPEADAQAEADASARAEAVARAEEAQEAQKVSEVADVDPPPAQKPQLSQALTAKRGRRDTRIQGRAEEEEQHEAEDGEEASQADDVTEEDQDVAHGSDDGSDDDDWDRGWSEEDAVVVQHHKRHGSSEVRGEAADTKAVRAASTMAVVHQHGSHGQGLSRQLRGGQGRKAEAQVEGEDEASTEEAEDRSEEEDESGEWAWSDDDKPDAKRL